MFEKQLASALDAALGTFFDGINSESLKLSVFAGNVTLSNLTLKPEVFDGLGVPVTLVAGHVGQVSLTVCQPWATVIVVPPLE